MFIGPEADRLAIRELIDRYSDAVMRRDADAYIATWATDGRWCFRGGEMVGHDQILPFWRKAMDGFAEVMFMANPGSIRIDGDRAEVVTYTFEHLEMRDGARRFQAGRYDDVIVRGDAGWQFQQRTFSARELKI